MRMSLPPPLRACHVSEDGGDNKLLVTHGNNRSKSKINFMTAYFELMLHSQIVVADERISAWCRSDGQG